LEEAEQQGSPDGQSQRERPQGDEVRSYGLRSRALEIIFLFSSGAAGRSIPFPRRFSNIAGTAVEGANAAPLKNKKKGFFGCRLLYTDHS
jgi:hypothetical protein